MGRVPDRLLAAFVALWMLLCLGLCVLWARSYGVPPNVAGGRDSLNITRSDPRYWVISRNGYLTLCRQEGKNWDNPLKEQRVLGLRFGGLWGRDGSLLWNLEMPYWMLATIIALPMPLGLWGWRKRQIVSRAGRLGLCRRCGYDLRATPGRCPECGAPEQETGFPVAVRGDGESN